MPTTYRAARRSRWTFAVVAASISLAASSRTVAAEQPQPTPAPAAAATPAPAVAAAAPAPPASLTDAERTLWQTEEAFAASFAARDPERFAAFLADDAVFAGRTVLRGKAAVREVWTKMMTSGPVAPFSWRPTRALVNGDIGTTSGPVYDPDGKWGGAFTSVWRLQPDGSWRIVLDGAAPCGDPNAAP